MENFSFKCSKIVKNALFLKKARVPSRMNAKKLIAVDIYFLLSNQNARKVLFTCLANTNVKYENVMISAIKRNTSDLELWKGKTKVGNYQIKIKQRLRKFNKLFNDI